MKLLEEIREFELFEQIITSQPEGLIIICDKDTKSLLEQEFCQTAGRLNRIAPNVTTLEDQAEISNASMLIVASLTNEGPLYQKLIAVAPTGIQVFRLWHDLFVNKSAILFGKKQASAEELFQQMPSIGPEQLKAIRSYAVLCTPRTGSTMLVEMLRQLDTLGLPREHLRNGILSLVEKTDFNFEHWAASVMMSQASKNGVFGTKIISHFLNRAIRLHEKERIVLPELSQSPKIIRLRRRDLISHALSIYISKNSKVFFERDQEKRNQRASFLANLKYDFDSLYIVYKNVIIEEYKVDKILEAFPGPKLEIIYEDIVENPTAELEKVLKFLELGIPDDFIAPQPTTTKLDDSKTQELYDHFSRDLTDRNIADSSTPSLRPGPYQAADEEIVDYQYFNLPNVPFRYRGPKPKTLESGGYFCTLGAAQTLGRFCTKPFPNLVSEAINMPVLNLGYSGAGPRLYLENSSIVDVANKATFAIVQIMSGRSEGNSLMRCDSGRNLVTWLPTGEQCFTEKAFRNLLADYNKDKVLQIVSESRENWFKHMALLLDSIEVPKILLWISEREPYYKPVVNGKLYDLLGTFPHLVDDSMLEQLSLHANATVLSISNRGIPHKLISRFTGNSTQVRYPNGEYRGEDRAYPTPEMHEDAASMLLPVVREILKGLG